MANRRRIIFKLLVFLLGGAMINVAVAWGCARAASGSVSSERIAVGWYEPSGSGELAGWTIVTKRCFGTFRTIAYPRLTPIVVGSSNPTLLFSWWTNWTQRLADFSRSDALVQMFDACGWPALALDAQCEGDERPRSATPDWTWGITVERLPIQGVVGRDMAGMRVLPLRPLWPGFAINTIFYAAILWMMFALPFAIRRRRRITRGLCVRCAYPVGLGGTCTECGAAVSPSSHIRF